MTPTCNWPCPNTCCCCLRLSQWLARPDAAALKVVVKWELKRVLKLVDLKRVLKVVVRLVGKAWPE